MYYTEDGAVCLKNGEAMEIVFGFFNASDEKGQSVEYYGDLFVLQAAMYQVKGHIEDVVSGIEAAHPEWGEHRVSEEDGSPLTHGRSVVVEGDLGERTARDRGLL